MKASSLTAYRVKILTNTPLLPVLASLAVNLPAAFLGVYRFSYDAYTHIFLADHYRRDWFSLWDGRRFGTDYCPSAIRKIWATFMRRRGMDPGDLELLQGRTPRGIFLRHYYRPDINTLFGAVRETLRCLKEELGTG
jgi:hypothetical protein